MRRAGWNSVVLALCFQAVALASPLPTRTIATVTLEEGGVGGSLTRLLRGRWVLGVSARELEETRWGWLTAGAVMPLGSGLVLDAQADLGRGDDDGRGFDVRMVRAALRRALAPQRLWVELEDRWIDVDRERGNLVRAGVLWLPRSTLLTSASAIRSTGGDLDAEYLTARADWTPRSETFILGATAGRSTPALFESPGGELPPVDVREVFAGVRRPARGGSVDLLIGLLRVGDEDRLRATIIWSF